MAWQNLNLFQRLTLQWEQLHPYNAGQVMHLALPLSPKLATDAWNQTLRDLQIGQVQLAGGRFCHLPANGDQVPAMLPALAGPDDLNGFIAEELNRPFEMHEGEAYAPFRPFLCPSASGMRIGIFYHHWVADSVSIRLLLREWFYRCLRPDLASRGPMQFLGTERYGSPAGWVRAAADLLAWSVRAKRVRRVPAVGATDLTVDFGYRLLPDGTAAQLHQAARQRQVKVGDLLVHALAEAVAKTMPLTHAHRPDLAIGTIRDTRVFDQPPDFQRFAMRLGFANIICPAVILADRERLLTTIAAEHHRHRQAAVRQANALEMRLGLAVGRFLSPPSLCEFYRKRLPLLAGVSNVDLSRSWVSHHHPAAIAAFFRISPAGPTLPMVVTPTTLGEQFNVAFTWRKQAFSPEHARAFMDAFTTSLTSWIA